MLVKVHRAKVIDEINRSAMVNKIAPYLESVSEESLVRGAFYQWIDAVACTDEAEGVELPQPSDPAGAIWDKFQDYLQMDATDARYWLTQVDEANVPLGKPALRPPQAMSDVEKKDTPPNEPKNAKK